MHPAPDALTFGKLRVEIHPDRRSAGAAAGAAFAARLRERLAAGPRARAAFACAPSQDECLDRLCGEPGIDWARVEAFHLDEYAGLGADHPQSFRHYLKAHVLDRVRPGTVHLIQGEAADSGAECARYEALLDAAPIDMICLGIGENGHVAFNDPPVADFSDPRRVKLVELDESCRRQQVNDGCFPEINAVPRRALTLTVPVFRDARALFVVVPGKLKAPAVHAMLRGPVSTACPASILREHPDATLYLDRDSASLL